MIQFDLPKEQSSILKVVGVGGGGGNAVNHMFSQNIEGVNFIICNTDAQALANSKIPNRVQLGPQLTSGLGAGANPEIGRQATVESLEEIRRILEVNTKMVFITAGMGGGTGTGGAPIIAKICKELGVLTVGIVTMPFAYEGKKRHNQAEEGIQQLKQYVDTLLVISNDKLRHQFGNLKMREAFEKADNVLATAAKCITDVITTTGQINVDFADVCTVMRNGGVAILGSASASGENRAQRAIEEALSSPLLNDNDIKGAKWILININSAEGEHEFTMDEVEIIQSHLLTQAGENTDVILGMGYDNSLQDSIGITLIATGFENQDPFVKPLLKKEEAAEGKIVMTLGEPAEIKQPETVAVDEAPAGSAIVQETAVAAPAEGITLVPDPMAPTLVDEAPHFDEVPMPAVEDILSAEPSDTGEKQRFELMFEPDITVTEPTAPQATDKTPPTDAQQAAFHSPSLPSPDRVMAAPPTVQEEEKKAPAAKGFLLKPVNIYAEHLEEKTAQAAVSAPEAAAPPADLFETPVAHSSEPAPAETNAEPPQPEEPLPVSEEELQRRKQMERLQKLRKLSFNVNANDPNSEFETIPAYIRRKMELNDTPHSQIESYYSKYEISADDNNMGQINKLNTFLDGKKPD